MMVLDVTLTLTLLYQEYMFEGECFSLIEVTRRGIPTRHEIDIM